MSTRQPTRQCWYSTSTEHEQRKSNHNNVSNKVVRTFVVSAAVWYFLVTRPLMLPPMKPLIRSNRLSFSDRDAYVRTSARDVMVKRRITAIRGKKIWKFNGNYKKLKSLFILYAISKHTQGGRCGGAWRKGMHDYIFYRLLVLARQARSVDRENLFIDEIQ